MIMGCLMTPAEFFKCQYEQSWCHGVNGHIVSKYIIVVQ